MKLKREVEELRSAVLGSAGQGDSVADWAEPVLRDLKRYRQRETELGFLAYLAEAGLGIKTGWMAGGWIPAKY
ncbi:MAG: hypothetical protein NTU53_08400 [Planctomycetota bacterium]|nr:hypothetical protein [Planctomycetota bacterium]